MIRPPFLDLSTADKEAIFNQISNETGMPSFAVEKDWWVVQTLSVIFELEAGKHLVFKGGTSLSKAWKLIQRFSEDVDLSIDRAFLGFGGELSKSKRTELRKAASEYTSGPFFEELQERFTAKGLNELTFNVVKAESTDQDPRIIIVNYPNVIKSPGYIEPRVQIEIGCRSMQEPFTIMTFASLVDETFIGSGFVQPGIMVPTVNPERTFLEKVFLLHEEFHRPIEKMRVERLSRHLYDVVMLANTEFAEKALSDPGLYQTIVDHRHSFTRVGGVNYNLLQTNTIDPLPIPAVLASWRADYQKMVEQMIYESSPPSFEEILSKLRSLKERINNLSWKFDKQYPTY